MTREQNRERQKAALLAEDQQNRDLQLSRPMPSRRHHLTRDRKISDIEAQIPPAETLKSLRTSLARLDTGRGSNAHQQAVFSKLPTISRNERKRQHVATSRK